MPDIQYYSNIDIVHRDSDGHVGVYVGGRLLIEGKADDVKIADILERLGFDVCQWDVPHGMIPSEMPNMLCDILAEASKRGYADETNG